MVRRIIQYLCVCVAALALPLVAFAHEVYVLDVGEIGHGLAAPAVSPFTVIAENFSQFMAWALIFGIALPTLFAMSLSRRLEKLFHPFFARMRTWAPFLVRIGVGASLIAFGYAGSIFGPEVPLQNIFGALAPVASIFLALAGAMILFNVYSRAGGCVLLAIFLCALVVRGWYVLTYIEYAAAAVFFIVGSSTDRLASGSAIRRRFAQFALRVRPYRFAILRVGFGLSVMLASLYAKIIYAPLALTVVEKYDLTSYWVFSSFSPEFLVLGAAIVEFLCGLLLVLGIEIRHTALFLAFWLTLSLAYFQEMVWPHIILFGLGGAFLLYGYDWYSLEGRYFKHGNREPIL